MNEFLDSINDHMRLKDEELALSISAQRLEGYEVLEGTNEETDKVNEQNVFSVNGTTPPALNIKRRLSLSFPLERRSTSVSSADSI